MRTSVTWRCSSNFARIRWRKYGTETFSAYRETISGAYDAAVSTVSVRGGAEETRTERYQSRYSWSTFARASCGVRDNDVVLARREGMVVMVGGSTVC